MPRIIGASVVFSESALLKNGGVAFENGKILAVDSFESLRRNFGDCKAEFFENATIAPGFVNAHIHFEFGKNVAQFEYGDFGAWHKSLMKKRDGVLDSISKVVEDGITEQLASGVVAVGAISSYGDDMKILADSPLKVVYFNEALGANPAALDFLFSNLEKRFFDCLALKNERFTPALAVHAPYSVHPKLLENVLSLAKEHNAILSAHFLESIHEKKWLEDSTGYFLDFFKDFGITNPAPFYTAESFLEQLRESPTLFTHCLEADSKHFTTIAAQKNFIISCPRSNKLLCNKMLDLSMLKAARLPLIIATDGKSSNNDVNLLNEARAALFGFQSGDLPKLASQIFDAISKNPAAALKLNIGILAPKKDADFGIYDLNLADIADSNQAKLQFLLHAKTPKKLFINGKQMWRSLSAHTKRGTCL